MKTVRDELEVIIRQKYEMVAKRRTKDDELSDDDWWEQISAAQDAHPEFRDLVLANKEEMVRSRRRFSPEAHENLIQSEIGKLLPIVETVRAECNATGPVLYEQYYEASHRMSRDEIAAAMAKMRDHVQSKPDAPNAWVMEKLLANAERDTVLMNELHANPSEELYKAFADQFRNCMEELTEEIKARARRK